MTSQRVAARDLQPGMSVFNPYGHAVFTITELLPCDAEGNVVALVSVGGVAKQGKWRPDFHLDLLSESPP